MIRIILFCYCVGVNFCVAQSKFTIAGKYINYDTVYPKLHESIILNKNNTFEYHRKSHLTEFNIMGLWQFKDNYLYLSSLDSNSLTLKANEKFIKNIPSNKFKLEVFYFDKTIPHCRVIINEGDESEIKYNDVFGTILLPKNGIKSITIYTVIKQKRYLVKDCSSNYIEFNVSSNRILKNEKWLLLEDRIIPVELDGNYANYSLYKEN